MLKISEKQVDNRTVYLEVEPNYHAPEEGKGKEDAVNFFMGHDNVNAIHSLISVTTSDARKFAQAILVLCDRIDQVKNE